MNKLMDVVFLPDRYPKAELKRRFPKIYNCLDSFGILEGKNELVRFVGLVSTNIDESVIFLPHGAPRENEANSDDFGKDVMNAITKFARKNSRAGTEDGGEPTLSFTALISAIVEDYREHGIFAERLRTRSINNGKPDWTATVRSQTPLIATNGAPIFADVKTVRPFKSSDNILAIIQAEVVREIYIRHGWWILDTFGERLPPFDIELPLWPREIWSRMLRSWRQNLFAERPIRLLNMLLAYLELSPNSSQGDVVCGISDFSTVWETMLKSVLPGVEDHWNARLPAPHYLSKDGSIEPSGRMVMDIVVRNGERLTVADAKYYRAVGVGSAPGWADIVKQIYYVEALKTVCGAADSYLIDSCFLFPAVDGEAGRLQQVAMYNVSGKVESTFPPTQCIYIGTQAVISAYCRGEFIDLPF